MRIILFAGKGGVGKTTIAAATACLAAKQGFKTLVMSLDPAHSLSDSFDLNISLLGSHKGKAVEIDHNLFLQELNIHEELAANWGEVHKYLKTLFNTSGIEDILAEELAILPGMEEINSLLYINHYVRTQAFDLIILDCAPTAESLRFVSLPTTLEWYMNKVFHIQRNIIKVVRPVADRISDIPLPKDDYFVSIDKLFKKLKGADKILTDMNMTSVRLVTNPEKMVLRETQRAYMFFRLHQLSIDAIVVNRVLAQDNGIFDLIDSQTKYLDLAQTYFSPIPILKAPWQNAEVLGFEQLEALARGLYQKKSCMDVFYRRNATQFTKQDDELVIKIHLPFATGKDLDLTKIGDELIIKAGNFKKNLILPRSYAALEPKGAKKDNEDLIIIFGEKNEHQ